MLRGALSETLPNLPRRRRATVTMVGNDMAGCVTLDDRRSARRAAQRSGGAHAANPQLPRNNNNAASLGGPSLEYQICASGTFSLPRFPFFSFCSERAAASIRQQTIVRPATRLPRISPATASKRRQTSGCKSRCPRRAPESPISTRFFRSEFAIASSSRSAAGIVRRDASPHIGFALAPAGQRAIFPDQGAKGGVTRGSHPRSR